jgi:hypothetical protein
MEKFDEVHDEAGKGKNETTGITAGLMITNVEQV